MTQHIGLLGATFDPVHNGHIQPALSVIEQLKLDALWLVPNQSPPYKSKPVATDTQRLKMLEIATNSHPQLHIAPHEINRQSFCYTTESLSQLKQQHPDTYFYFMIGLDSYHALHTWYNWRQLIAHAHVIVYQRPGISTKQANPEVEDWTKNHECSLATLKHSQTGHICFIDVPQIDVSSTLLRHQLATSHTPAPDTLPSSVLKYIQEESLYQQKS
tara:strand:+ start:7128 stop:7775 length:648 start_codon:yes stop_codon:yes gene_type:complete